MDDEKHRLPTTEETRQIVKKSYGNKVERTLLDISEAWKELEADPGLFSLLARDLAGEEVDVVEIYDIHQDLESYVAPDEKVYGLVFLFEVREGQGDRSQRIYNKDLQKKYFVDEAVINHKMFFALQRAPNSCATHALLSIILNNADLRLTPLVQNFKAFTQEMPPEARGYAIANSPQFAAFHNRRAPSSPEVVATVTSNMRRSTESSRSRRTYSRQNHFVTYVHIDGQLMELDGLKDYPICHGPVTADNYVKTTLKNIDHRINSTTGIKGDKDRHSILLVKASRRTRCIRQLGSIQTNETTKIDRIESLLDVIKPSLPVEGQEIVTAYRKRILWSSRPENFPANLGPVPDELTSICEKILPILTVSQQKFSTLISDQKALISTLVPLVPSSPLRNGFSAERERSPEIAVRRLCFFNTQKSTDLISANGFHVPSRDKRGHESSGDWVKKAQIWPVGMTLCTEPDLSLVNELQTLSGEYIKKNATVETRKQRAAAKNHRFNDECNVRTSLSARKIVLSKYGKSSATKRWDPIPTTLQPQVDEESEGDLPQVPAKVSIRTPTPVVSKRDTVMTGSGPPERLINRITKVDGRLRSSSIAQSSKCVQPEDFFSPNKSTSESHETSSTAVVSPLSSMGRQEPSESPSQRLRMPRSSLSQRTQERSPYVEYRSIVINPLTEAKNQLQSLEHQISIITNLQSNLEQFIQLEKQRTDLLKIIVEENGKREEDMRNAIEREFPHAEYITRLLKRITELKLIGHEELTEILPPKPSLPSSKRSESGESLQSLAFAKAGRHRLSSSNDEDAVTSKKRRS